MRAALLLVAAACSQGPSESVHVVVSTPRGDVAVTAEVPSTPRAIKRGLMHRERLDPDRGMLFFMREDRDWAFWMRDTLIPLDILFITKDMTIAGIVEHAVPRSDTQLRVGARSRYVLEVNAGWAESHGVERGMQVRFETAPR